MSATLSRSHKRKGEGNYFEVTAGFEPPFIIESAAFHADRKRVIRAVIKQIGPLYRKRRGDLHSTGVIFWQLVGSVFLFRSQEVEEAYSRGEMLSDYLRGRQMDAGGVSSQTHSPKALVTKFLPMAVEELLSAIFAPQSVEYAAIFELQIRAYR